MHYRRYGVLILLLFFIISPLRAQEFEESAIAFQISKTKWSDFFEVLTDSEERPYLDIVEVTENWLEMKPICDLLSQSCKIISPVTDDVYFIDPAKQVFGTKSKEFPIPNNSFVLVNNRLYLRYDVWQQWMPVTVSWDANFYHLKLIPSFPLLADLAKQREILRQQHIEKAEENKKFEKIAAHQPPSDLRTEFRYQIGAEYIQTDNQSQQVNPFHYKLGSDVYQGTFTLWGSSIHREGSAIESTTTTSEPLWNYHKRDVVGFHSLDLGRTRIDRTLLFPFKVLNNGIFLRKLKKFSGRSLVTFSGVTEPNTEIDLFQNGIFHSMMRSDKDGNYEFENVSVTGGELLSLKFYFSDGFHKEEITRIAFDDGLLLGDGKTDVQLATGTLTTNSSLTTDSSLAYAAVRHGAMDNLALGLHLFNIESEVGEQTLLTMSDLVFRPIAGINFLMEGLSYQTESEDQPLDLGTKVYLSTFHPNLFQFEIQRLGETSPLLQLSQGRATTLNRMRHQLSFQQWQFSEEYSETEIKRTTLADIRKKITYQFSVFTSPKSEYLILEDQTNQTVLVGGEYNLSRSHSFLLQRLFSSINLNTFIYQFQGLTPNNWTVVASVSSEDEGKMSGSVSVVWRPTTEIQTTVTLSEGRQSSEVVYSNIVAAAEGPDEWKEFGAGILYGTIHAPKVEGEEPEPVEGAVVLVGSKRGVTNEDGYYKITGLPVYQKLRVQVDPDSLDIGTTPKDELHFVQFRPGTQLEYSTETIASVGLDGMVIIGRSIPSGVTVVALRDGKEYASAIVESDGFFVIESIAPGLYILQVQGLEEAPDPIEVNIDPEMEWVSDVELR